MFRQFSPDELFDSDSYYYTEVDEDSGLVRFKDEIFFFSFRFLAAHSYFDAEHEFVIIKPAIWSDLLPLTEFASVFYGC